MKNGQRKKPNIPQKNLLIYGLYLMILIAFGMLVLLPDYIKIQRIDSDIEKMETKIREQNFLSEQYKICRAELEKLERINYHSYPRKKEVGEKEQEVKETGEKEQGEQCNVTDMQNQMRELVIKFGFCAGKIGPERADMQGRIPVIIEMSGDIEKFHDFYIELGKMQCIEKIDQIEIYPSKKKACMEIPSHDYTKKIIIALRMLTPVSERDSDVK